MSGTKIRKEKVIDSLMILLTQKTLEEIKSDEIAAKAEISKRTLYKYFSSKKEMYLALVQDSFSRLAETIKMQLDNLQTDEPWEKIAIIGHSYLEFCLSSPIRAKIILEYDEMNYVNDFPERVKDISNRANTFELSPYIREYYDFYGLEPGISAEVAALYLWAEIHGLAQLLTSKREWIKMYYGVEEQKIVREHMMISRKILEVMGNDK